MIIIWISKGNTMDHGLCIWVRKILLWLRQFTEFFKIMIMLNLFKFELTSFRLVYIGPKRRVSIQWLKNVMLFGEMHCSRIKKLDICGGLHDHEFPWEFPLKNYLRSDSLDKIRIVTRDRPIYLNNEMIL